MKLLKAKLLHVHNKPPENILVLQKSPMKENQRQKKFPLITTTTFSGI